MYERESVCMWVCVAASQMIVCVLLLQCSTLVLYTSHHIFKPRETSLEKATGGLTHCCTFKGQIAHIYATACHCQEEWLLPTWNQEVCVHLCVRKVGNNEGNFQALFIIPFVAVTGVELKGLPEEWLTTSYMSINNILQENLNKLNHSFTILIAPCVFLWDTDCVSTPRESGVSQVLVYSIYIESIIFFKNNTWCSHNCS